MTGPKVESTPYRPLPRLILNSSVPPSRVLSDLLSRISPSLIYYDCTIERYPYQSTSFHNPVNFQKFGIRLACVPVWLSCHLQSMAPSISFLGKTYNSEKLGSQWLVDRAEELADVMLFCPGEAPFERGWDMSTENTAVDVFVSNVHLRDYLACTTYLD